MFPFDKNLQRCACVMKAGFNGPGWTIEDSAHVRRREIVQVMECQNFAMMRWEDCQSFMNRFGIESIVIQVELRGLIAGEALLQFFLAYFGPNEAGCFVVSDSVKPSAEGLGKLQG